MKSSLFSYVLFSLLSLSAMAVHAQSCPEGYEVTGGQGAYGCAPRPDNESYNQPQQPQQQAPQAPSEQWKSQWGAIATDSVKGTLGTAVSLESREKAMQAAMTDCQKKGGTQCNLDAAYDNECAAMVVGHTGYHVTTDATQDKAILTAMASCKRSGYGDCHVYYTACSLPVRIQ